jgi:hypothetical protein
MAEPALVPFQRSGVRISSGRVRPVKAVILIVRVAMGEAVHSALIEERRKLVPVGVKGITLFVKI